MKAFTPQMCKCAKDGLQRCAAYEYLREKFERAGIVFDGLDREVSDARDLFERVIEESEREKQGG